MRGLSILWAAIFRPGIPLPGIRLAAFWLAAIWLANVAALCIPAVAQEQRYDSPPYTTGTGSTVDKNFGLPSFGMPNADLPRQKTQEPEPKVHAPTDVFAKAPEYFVSTPIDPTGSAMETPLFTTPEGYTTGDMTTTDTTADTATSSYGTNRR